jgi:hypothetical protein
VNAPGAPLHACFLQILFRISLCETPLEIDMKLSKIALAVAGLAAAAAASAAPLASRIAVSAGASATFNNLNTAMGALCTSAGGVKTTLGAGNFRSIVCANTAVTAGAAGTYVSKTDAQFINFAGTNYAELRVNTEGSFSAVLILNPGVNPTPPAVFDPAPGAAGANSSAYPAGSTIVGGLLDLDPSGFPATTVGANNLFGTTPVGIAQTFGVAVSDALYSKLFAAQQAAGSIPASCTVTATNLSYCVPSIGTAQMAGIMVDNPFNAAYGNGLGFLTGVAADNGTELRYVRRVDNSGTQAAAQVHLLGLPCSKVALPVVAQPTTIDPAGSATVPNALNGAIRVYGAPGTGDVRTELNKAGVFALGVISGENVQAQTWKYVRLQGVEIGENAVPSTSGVTNTASAKAGRYNFAFESVYMGGTAAGNAFWSTVSTSLNSLPAPAGLINATDLAATYSKAGSACQAWVAN